MTDKFPNTRLSAILAAGSDDPAERTRAFEALIAAYWMPVYKYTRIKWNKPSEDAKDLTQGFFAEAMEKRFFDRYDPARAKFRTFLRTCLDGFIANEAKAASRIKRGGGVTILSLDFEGAESQLLNAAKPAPGAMDDYFDREWARSVLTLSLERFRTRMIEAGKTTHLQLFERYMLDDDDHEKPSYKSLADQFRISTTDVTNYLAYSRRQFRAIVLDKLRELTVTDEEFRREARALIGVDPA